MKQSPLELQFAQQLQDAGLPTPECEYLFALPRRYRFDFCWPDLKLAVELEGGVFRQGKQGHSSVTGIVRDMAKANLATSLGWRVYRFHALDLNDETALRTIAQELARTGPTGGRAGRQ